MTKFGIWHTFIILIIIHRFFFIYGYFENSRFCEKFKGTDFATNLRTGFLKNSLLAEALDAVLREPSPGFFIFQDYQPYLPSHNDPAAIIASPIFKDGALVSILAVQISADPIN